MARPWRLFFACVAVAFLVAAPLGWGQVYSWVDDDGKRHYGDSVPPEYRDRATEYQVRSPNTSQAVEVRGEASLPPSEEDTGRPSWAPPPVPDESCEAQMEAYEESQDCFKNCRRMVGGRINVTECGHCTNVKKPDC